MAETKADSVPNLGFKDKEKALETIQALKGRDPDYQKLAIKGLIGRANRVISITKAEDKINNIKAAVQVFDEFLKDFEKSQLSKANMAYLPSTTVQIISKLQKHYDIKNEEFIEAFIKTAGGDYKKLRTIDSTKPGVTWDIVRNDNLKTLKESFFEGADEELWTENGIPTKLHTQLILWAYSPDASKLKKNLSTIEAKINELAQSANGSNKTATKRKSISKKDEEAPSAAKKTSNSRGKKKLSSSDESNE